jgi:hypothetical protein
VRARLAPTRVFLSAQEQAEDQTVLAQHERVLSTLSQSAVLVDEPSAEVIVSTAGIGWPVTD